MSIAAKCTCGHSVSGICTGSTTPQCKNLIKPMDKTTERIKADALKAIKVKDWGESLQIESYIAGATAENEKAQKMADALEWIKTYGPVDELTVKFIDNALEQWKGTGKEVENG